MRVVGVNAVYAFTFVREDAEGLRWASVPVGGSQFRSCDLWSEAAGDVVAGIAGALAREIEPSKIPDVPKDSVAYVDGYGNIKTTTKHAALAISSGTALGVRIGDVEREATASDATMAEHTKITALDNGPDLVKGPVLLLAAAGNAFRAERATATLCRCGGSMTKPFCNSTNSKAGFRAAERAVRLEGGRV